MILLLRNCGLLIFADSLSRCAPLQASATATSWEPTPPRRKDEEIKAEAKDEKNQKCAC
jgi:hypothetical protein